MEDKWVCTTRFTLHHLNYKVLSKQTTRGCSLGISVVLVQVGAMATNAAITEALKVMGIAELKEKQKEAIGP